MLWEFGEIWKTVEIRVFRIFKPLLLYKVSESMITKESITPRPLLLCEDVLTSPKNVPLYLLPGCLADAR